MRQHDHFSAGIVTQKRVCIFARLGYQEAMDATNALVASPSKATSDLGSDLVELLPTLLLYPTQTGTPGGKEKPGGKRLWASRFDLFWEGRWEALLTEARSRVPRPQSAQDVDPAAAEVDPQEAAQRQQAGFRRAADLVKQGELSRAASSLTASPVAPANLETFEKLKALHPRRLEPLEYPDVGAVPPPPLQVDPKSLIAALRSAPRGSAPGISGWRYEHLKWFLGRSDAPEGCVPLPAFVDRMLRGDLPEAVRSLLAAARIFGLDKDDGAGGVRPIAIGDVLRRWVTKAICLEHNLQVAEELAPLQMAVGTSAACEKVYRIASTYIETRPDERRVLVTLDAKNAFNSLDRQAIFDALADRFPSLVPFFWQFYGEEAGLWFRLSSGEVLIIDSEEGVQQGDAAGPLLFCLGLHAALEKLFALIREHDPDALLEAFMDDVTGGVKEEFVGLFVALACQVFATYRLELRLDKCHAYSPAWDPFPPPLTTLPAGLQVHGDGLTLLGAPLGRPAFMAASLREAAARRPTEALLAVLIDFASFDLQAAFLLLRFCALPCFAYWCRLLPRAVLLDAARDFDTSIQDTAVKMLGLPALTEPQRRQLCLPIREGGCGLTSWAAICDAAYAASGASTLSSVWALFQDAPWMPDGREDGLLATPWAAECADAGQRVNAAAGADVIGPLASFLTEPAPRQLQHRLSGKLHAKEAAALLASFPLGGVGALGATRDAARFLSCQGPGAGAFLHAVPYEPALTLNNGTFRIAISLRLGLPIPQARVAQRCVCGTHIDQWGDHLFCCRNGGQWQFRHDAIRGLFQRLLRDAHVPAQHEVMLRDLGVLPPNGVANDQRMDLVWMEEGRTCLGDVCITHPCRPDETVQPMAQYNRLHGRPQDGGRAAREAAWEKRKTYDDNVRHAGFSFTPLPFETFGRAGPEVETLLKRLASRHRRVVNASGAERSFVEGTVVARGWKLLSCGLMRLNAFLLTVRAQRAHEAAHPDHAALRAEDVLGRGPLHPR